MEKDNSKKESVPLPLDKGKNKNKTQDVKKLNYKKPTIKWKWPLKVLLLTFSLSTMFSLVSELVLSKSNIFVSILVICVLLITGLVFDMIGVAATAGDPEPIMSMASRKVRGAKESISIIKNASKVSSFCCDIIGDICGILGGAAGASITFKIISQNSQDTTKILVSALASGIIAALTVFLKSIGKGYAVDKSNNIILITGKVLSVFTKKQ